MFQAMGSSASHTGADRPCSMIRGEVIARSAALSGRTGRSITGDPVLYDADKQRLSDLAGRATLGECV